MWDIFCNVIDNYGDAGVCWRLAADLAARGQRVRLWIDQPDSLRWMAPRGCPGVEVRHWVAPLATESLPSPAGDVLIEAFGCELDTNIQAWWAGQHSDTGLWLNLEYLSAEEYVARCHLLSSPVMSGPAAGHTKLFYYPGFTPATGGLLREPGLLLQQQNLNSSDFLHSIGCEQPAPLVASLFCYEPDALLPWLEQLAASPSTLLVMQGRGHAALCKALGVDKLPERHGACSLHRLPWLDHPGFDRVLWSCDFNAVRGEDSLVRALWAGKPFVWHIYPQHDDAHHAKLDAFLDWLEAPEDWRTMHYIWNGMTQGDLPALTPQRRLAWQQCALAARARLLQQPDLVSQLLALADQRTPSH